MPNEIPSIMPFGVVVGGGGGGGGEGSLGIGQVLSWLLV